MSGVFNPDAVEHANATDDPVLARRLGLTHWDAVLGQWRAPRPGDPLPRIGEGRFFQPLDDVEPDPAQPDEGSEPSRGISSSTSSPETGTSTEPGRAKSRKRAPTTDSPS